MAAEKPNPRPKPPPKKVRERQDPDHTEDEFLRDLDRASRRLVPPSERDRESSKKAE
jgi:hypothetical protein